MKTIIVAIFAVILAAGVEARSIKTDTTAKTNSQNELIKFDQTITYSDKIGKIKYSITDKFTHNVNRSGVAKDKNAISIKFSGKDTTGRAYDVGYNFDSEAIHLNVRFVNKVNLRLSNDGKGNNSLRVTKTYDF